MKFEKNKDITKALNIGLGWISVADEMPEDGKCVLIFSEVGGVAEGAYFSASKYFEQWRWSIVQKNVTHWKPLPAGPTII